MKLSQSRGCLYIQARSAAAIYKFNEQGQFPYIN
jgi:hypothetical protein